MKLPFITRGHYEEMKELLLRQIAALEEDRRRLLDHLQKLSTGEAVYEKPAPAPAGEISAAQMLPETEDQRRMNLVRQAMNASGSRNPRVIAEWISRYHERNFAQRMEKAAGPEAVALSIEQAIAEGRQAAAATVVEEKRTA